MASFFDNKARAAAAKAAQTNGAARPKTLNDITSQPHTTTTLTRTLRTTNLPHLLFYGPPGTGKTSTILALSKQLFGPDLFKSRVLELNASDERGISVVRTKIKDFARQQLSALPAGPAGKEYASRYPVPPFKIIVLDEADSMTQDAQSALRRTIETYSRITRFCLICNYVTRIIDPLASRCSKFRFKSLGDSDAVGRLEMIAEAEGVKLEDGVSNTLAKVADGDLRRAITLLQSAGGLVRPVQTNAPKKKKGSKKIPDDDEEPPAESEKMDVDAPAVSSSMVQEIAGVIPETVLATLIQAVTLPLRERTNPGKTYDAIRSAMTAIIADGWPAAQLLGQLYEALIFEETIDDRAKVGMMGVFSEADKRLIDGADEELTVLDAALRCSGALTRYLG
ncbi:MAG: hypothetical protein Q9162_004066 [Coniocarpon cinnabarinum]